MRGGNVDRTEIGIWRRVRVGVQPRRGNDGCRRKFIGQCSDVGLRLDIYDFWYQVAPDYGFEEMAIVVQLSVSCARTLVYGMALWPMASPRRDSFKARGGV